MANSAVHPDQVLQALIDKGNRKDKDAKLRRLHELCAMEYNHNSQGARDMSFSHISRLAESHGLFKARTIYNKQSEDYAALITAWGEYNGPKLVKVRKAADAEQKTISKYDFLNKIDDPAVRSLCQMALIQRDKLKAEIDQLKGQTQLVIDMRPLGAEIAKDGKNKNVAVIETVAQLTDSERTALEEAISGKFLTSRNWKAGDAGEVVDERERFVFKPGFISAVQKILGKTNMRALNGDHKTKRLSNSE